MLKDTLSEINKMMIGSLENLREVQKEKIIKAIDEKRYSEAKSLIDELEEIDSDINLRNTAYNEQL